MTIKAKNRVVIRRAPTNGANGKPGMAMVLNPANIVLDTETDGLVHNFSKATCTVQLMQGTLLFAPTVSILQQVRCSAQVSGSVIRITGISIQLHNIPLVVPMLTFLHRPMGKHSKADCLCK
ncbi:MAG: hypothetical protein HXO20_04390 [Prevotella shahii]|nr:hypothetical protein [Hoylesella shahii]